MLRFLPILIAAVASFGFSIIWYSVFSKQWLDAVGMTEADFLDESGNPKAPLAQMAVNFVCQAIMAGVFAIVLTWIGPTVVNGVAFGALLWLGFVLTTIITYHVYRNTGYAVTLIDGGHWLGVVLIQGFLIGLILR